MNSGPKYKEYEDQTKREKSFLNYPKPYPLKEDLVRAGFYYLGSGAGNDDDCQCYYCGVRLFNWTKEDDPLKEHEKFRPNCLVIKTIRNPSNNPPPMNMHPTENAKYPEIESKIQNTQTIYEPQPGTITTSFYPKQNDSIVKIPVSKEELYSHTHNSRKSESAKQQHYPIRQISQESETARVETTSRHPLPNNNAYYYSSLHTNFPLQTGQIAFDHIHKQTPNINANISSSFQPHNSGRFELRPQELIPRRLYYPQPQQAIPEQATFGNQQLPSQSYGAINQNPSNATSFDYQFHASDPTYGSNSYGNSYNSYDQQVLSPHPILHVAPQPEIQNIQSIQTQYSPSHMNSNIQTTKFPLQIQTSLDNPTPPQAQNYLQIPQVQQNPHYQQYPQ